jgi:hypothetical protein
MQLEPDEIRGYKQDSFFNQNTNKPNEVNPFTIFLSVLAAILFAWFIREAYFEWQVKKALELFNQEMSLVNEESQRSIERIRQQSIAMQEAANERQRQAEAAAYQNKLALHQQELAKQAEKEAEIEARSNKADAWLAFYKPSKACESENKNIINCGNEFARAKNKFEIQWGASH